MRQNTAPLQLSRLRDIGWSLWDPIGLRPAEGGWQASPAADEYDGYLLHVAGLVRRDEADEDGAAYLLAVETGAMGLPESATARPRALETVRAIRRYVASLPDG